MVEFALVLPVAVMLMFGLIAASWLFFQTSALTDGAASGARSAAIEAFFSNSGKGLDQTPAPGVCTGAGLTGAGETGTPEYIADAVAREAPQLNVNDRLPNGLFDPHATLCVVAGSNGNEMRQWRPDPTKAEIFVSGCSSDTPPAPVNGIDSPRSIRLTVTISAQGIAPPFRPVYPLTASSTVPVPQTDGSVKPCTPLVYP